MFVGVHVPSERRHRRHKHHHKSVDSSGTSEDERPSESFLALSNKMISILVVLGTIRVQIGAAFVF